MQNMPSLIQKLCVLCMLALCSMLCQPNTPRTMLCRPNPEMWSSFPLNIVKWQHKGDLLKIMMIYDLR